MTKCITLEYPDGSIATRGGIGPKMLARFNGDADAARQYIFTERVPIQNPDAVARIEDITFPADKWFRAAWVRAPGGGAIDIDMPKAREIQAERIQAARGGEIGRLQNEEDRARLVGRTAAAAQHAADRAALETMDLKAVAASIAAAANPTALKAIWPAGLPLQE